MHQLQKVLLVVFRSFFDLRISRKSERIIRHSGFDLLICLYDLSKFIDYWIRRLEFVACTVVFLFLTTFLETAV